MGEWQRIDTAPRDRTKVLLGRFTGERRAAHEGLVEVDFWRTGEANDGYTGWGRFNARFWPPTHWMPLPTAPDSRAAPKTGGSATCTLSPLYACEECGAGVGQLCRRPAQGDVGSDQP